MALRYADGVVMAGDRRATEGHFIAHRAMEKVFPADRHSAVAIAGAAGPAIEMVRLFQTQLEHYEKVEGVALSLEGKANQLGQMVREHLPMAMQGLVVVPLFAGYDLRAERRADLHLRRHRRPLRGGRLRRHRLGRPRRPHHDQARLAARPEPRRGRRAGRAGALRGGRRGLRHRWARPGARASTRSWRPSRPRATSGWRDAARSRTASVTLVERRIARGGVVMTMPFYVAPEQVMKDRAEYAQKGIARGRSLVATLYDDGILIVAENPSRTLHKISEIYDRIAFAGVGKYNEFDQLRVAGVRHADTKGFAFSREDVDARSLANLYAQFLGQVFTHEMKPLEVEILVAELGDRAAARPAVPHRLRRHDHRRGALRRARRRGRDHHAALRRPSSVDGWDLDAALRGGGGRAGRARPDPRGRGSRGRRARPGNGRRAFRRIGVDGRDRATSCSAGSSDLQSAVGSRHPGRPPSGTIAPVSGDPSNMASTWSARSSSRASSAWSASTSTSTSPGNG